MKNYKESQLFDNQMNSLEDELQELMDKAEVILEYKSDDINLIVEDLLAKNTEESITLATDIMDIEEDILVSNEDYYYEDEISDDPFNNLYDEDEDIF
jgi:hypothetical protein